MKSNRWQFYLIGVWFLFTLSLAIWWLFFALTQVDQGRHTKMLVYEGVTLVLMLSIGAGVLTYFVNREMRERKKLQQFFAALSHEIKTPLSSVNLDVEVLQEKLTDAATLKSVNRIRSNIGRLSLQLENSLFLADEGAKNLIIEPLSLKETIESVKPFFQTLTVVCEDDCKIKADSRAFKAILSNIFSNAITHGEATQISIFTKTLSSNQIEITFHDNGKGFRGEIGELAKPFVRHYTGSGSGVGLFLVNQLCRRMGGLMQIESSTEGFCLKTVLKT